LLPLTLIFVAAAGVVWAAGVRLSDATDVLSERFGLGQALGGLLLLAIVTNLPEIAITASASLSGELGIAVGNILGGIAIQTAVLVLVDAFGVRGSRPLSYQAASLVLVLEGTLVIAVLAVTVMSSRLPSSLIFERVTPGGVLIVIFWVVGIWMLSKARNELPWLEKGEAPGGQQAPRGMARARKERDARNKGIGTPWILAVFALASVVTLVAGVALERSGEVIAGRIGMDGVLFGSTVLAAATALPEVSTGLASRLELPETALLPHLERLEEAGLLVGEEDGYASLVLSVNGHEVIDRLVGARRQALAELLDGWSPEQHEELARMLGRLARELLQDDPHPGLVGTRGGQHD
jgi:cation:H+ antiporter